MRKLVVGVFTSLDGTVQSPGGQAEDPSGGFRLGGWAAALFDQQLREAMAPLFARPFDLLLGRRTWEIFAAHWPYLGPENPLGAAFGEATKHVATSRPEQLSRWRNSIRLGSDLPGGDVPGAVRALKAAEGPGLLTQGSSSLVRCLFEEDLVDELVLMTFPVILGRGKRLFGDASAPVAFELVDQSASGAGVIVSRYRKAGPVLTGNFQLDPPTAAEVERRRSLD